MSLCGKYSAVSASLPGDGQPFSLEMSALLVPAVDAGHECSLPRGRRVMRPLY